MTRFYKLYFPIVLTLFLVIILRRPYLFYDTVRPFGQNTTGEEINFPLNAVGESGVNGTATIKEVNDLLVVLVDLDLETPKGVSQSFIIYRGECDNLSEVVYQLWASAGGTDTTYYTLSMEDMTEGDTLSVTASKSFEESDVIISCGEIPRKNETLNS